MEIKINSLQAERPFIPLLEGQIRLKEDKSRIILITRDTIGLFGVTYLKTDNAKTTHATLETPIEKENFEKWYPIVADSASLMININ